MEARIIFEWVNIKRKETGFIFKAVLGKHLLQKVNNKYAVCHSNVRGGR